MAYDRLTKLEKDVDELRVKIACTGQAGADTRGMLYTLEKRVNDIERGLVLKRGVQRPVRKCAWCHGDRLPIMLNAHVHGLWLHEDCASELEEFKLSTDMVTGAEKAV